MNKKSNTHTKPTGGEWIIKPSPKILMRRKKSHQPTAKPPKVDSNPESKLTWVWVRHRPHMAFLLFLLLCRTHRSLAA